MQLSVEGAAFFYESWMALLTWINDELGVVPKFTVPSAENPIATALAHEVRCAMWKRQDLVERYVAENPMGATSASLAWIDGFRHRVQGEFVALKTLPTGTIFLETSPEGRAFRVVGISDPVLFDATLPTMVKAVLLPFGDVIVYDTFLEAFPVGFGPGARRAFEESYRSAKKRARDRDRARPEPGADRPRVEDEDAHQGAERACVDAGARRATRERRCSDGRVLGGARQGGGGGGGGLSAVRSQEGEITPEIFVALDPTGKLAFAEPGAAGVAVALGAKRLASLVAAKKAKRSKGSAAPTPRVYVADSPLAAELRRHLGTSFEVVVQPTPQIDEAIADLTAHLVARGFPSAAPEMATEEAVAAAFRGAKALYDARPWAVVPDEDAAFVIDVPALDVHGCAVTVTGVSGGDLGIHVHPSLDALLAAEVRPLDAHEPDEGVSFIVGFRAPKHLPESYVKEIKRAGYAIPSKKLVTLLLRYEGSNVEVVASAHDIVLVEAVTRAIAASLEDGKALVAAWLGEAEYERTRIVPTSRGGIEVRVAVEVLPPAGDVEDIVSALRQRPPPNDSDVLDLELYDAFLASPLAEEHSEDVELVHLTMGLFARTFRRSLVSATPQELHEVLFGEYPKKVSLPKEHAGPLLAALRAFVRFLVERGGLGDELLRELSDAQVPQLEAALGDERRFDPAKRVAMAALAAGVDLSSPEEVERFAAQYTERAPGPMPSAKRAAEDKRAARKATKKARRKNRS
jgi:hypothetical protein